jgi:hypothetical protein
MFRALAVLSGIVMLSLGVGCASLSGMMAGSPAWFENQRADVAPLAATDLDCKAKPITFKPVSSDDYREVEATGCDKKVSYKLVKVAMISKWVKAGDVSSAH